MSPSPPYHLLVENPTEIIWILVFFAHIFVRKVGSGMDIMKNLELMHKALA
jgi:hypothetical protein